MNHPNTRGLTLSPGRAEASRDEFVPSSRRVALDLVRSALGAGPVLITGDAGIGKTWLWQRVAAGSTDPRSWVDVDLSPADDPASFLRAVGHSLGLEPTGHRWGRTDLRDALAERAADGERRVLVVEEAHNLSAAVAEEIRVLSNRLGRPDGFAGLVLVGQTSLAFRMSNRPLAALEARLAARIHLTAIDADEAREIMARHQPDPRRTVDSVEQAHRDAAGNPRRLLRSMARLDTPAPRLATVSATEAPTRSVSAPPLPVAPPPAAPAPTPAPVAVVSPTPLTGPDRPPLHVEDGLIEVGWSADEAASTDDADDKAPAAGPREEAVHDHYAALQAWREWTDNQNRRELAELGMRPAPNGPVGDEDEETDPDPDALTPHVRIDEKREFAPFGQLFSKMTRAHEPE